jgi:hypothetical protein
MAPLNGYRKFRGSATVLVIIPHDVAALFVVPSKEVLLIGNDVFFVTGPGRETTLGKP